MLITIYTDGGSLNNPGRAAIAYVIYLDGKIIKEHFENIGIASNNVAEYTALIRGLEKIKELLVKRLEVKKITHYADSELMVRQLNGVYKVKHVDMKKLFEQVSNLKSQISIPIYHVHVLREKNALADSLVKKALSVKSV